MAGIHGLFAGRPVGWAHLAVLLDMLEGLHKTQGLVGVAAHGKVVDAGVAEDAGFVDDESASECNGAIWSKHAVVLRDLLGKVREHRDLHVTETSLAARLLGVLHVREVGVDRAGNQFAVDILECFGGVVEGTDLCRAHKGEVERVEEEDNVFASVVRQANLLESSVGPGHTRE